MKTVDVEEYKKLIEWLKIQRQTARHTHRSLAPLLNVSHASIWKTESLNRRLDIIEYIRYCKALNADPMEGLKCLTAMYQSQTTKAA